MSNLDSSSITLSEAKSADHQTAAAFASSWNHLPSGSVYSREQFEEWMEPVKEIDVRDKEVLELGCGNASLLVHTTRWSPARVVGVDLGESVLSAKRNMGDTAHMNWSVERADLTKYESDGFDLVYCIGVLHHLVDPEAGFRSVIKNTKPGGRFHCWVYAYEGNGVIRTLVEPLRRVCCRLPWWLTKYFFALPLVLPFFVYAKALALLPHRGLIKRLPLFEYAGWIGSRELRFFHHVAFDQLVTPRTSYIRRATIERWLASHPRVKLGSTYVIFRNGNSWKFGGRVATSV